MLVTKSYSNHSVFNEWDSNFGEEKRRKRVAESLEDAELRVLVSHTAFKSIASTDSGGVISYSKTGPILIEFSTFTKCSSEANGGCIYVDSQCDCTVDCVCSYICYAKSAGQFIYANLQSGNHLNYVHRSSICSTSDVSGSYSAIYGLYGNRECISVNISNTYVTDDAAIYYISGSSNKNNIRYCAINNNHASGGDCLHLQTSGLFYTIEECNIIDNTHVKDGGFGIIYCHSATVTIDKCCFRNNTGGKLFCSETSGTITVKDCIIDQRYSESGNNNINPTTNSLSLNFNSLIDDCSQLVRVKCNTKECGNKFTDVLSLFANLFVSSVMIAIKFK